MIEQNVQVVRCEDDKIWVRMGSRSGCSACDNGRGCGAGVFAKLLQGKPVIMELARQDFSVGVGQMVTLAFPEQLYLRMVLAYYGWPLVAALIGAFAAYELGSRLQFAALPLDAITLAGGLLAGGLALYTLKERQATEAVFNALQLIEFHPSATPGMCQAEDGQPQNK